MKGFSHFLSGMAAASCFPETVLEASQGNPLYFILGGVFALLPDTLDAKLCRYFYRHDAEVIPDPLAPDPHLIANAVAAAIHTAAAHRRPFRLRLRTIRLGADRWQRYCIRFDPARQQVEARIDGIVDNRGRLVPGTPSVQGEPGCAVARVTPPLHLEGTAVVTVSIFNGPLFRMTPDDTGAVTVQCNPWRRQWSHSILTGLGLALPVGFLLGWMAFAVAATAQATHVLLDQLGHKGSLVLWPISRRRTPGLKRSPPNASLPNLITGWCALLLIYRNLAAFSGLPVPAPHPLRLAVLGILLPRALITVFRRHPHPAFPPGARRRQHGANEA